MSAENGRVLVEARDVRREYRLKGDLIEAVRGISLEVGPGDFLAIVGPSISPAANRCRR